MSAYETYMSTHGMFVSPRRASNFNVSDDFNEFASKNEDWKKLQRVVISIFQRKPIRAPELMAVNKTLSVILQSPGGSFLQEYYNDQLLMRGMIILREPMRGLKARKLIDTFSSTWNYFYSEILPNLSAIFYKIETKASPIRKITLIAFKEIVIHKLPLLNAFKEEHALLQENATIRQMLLIIQTTTEKSTVDYKLQELITFVVKPYFCQSGFFMGPGKPVLKSTPSQPEDTVTLRKKSLGSMDNLDAGIKMECFRPKQPGARLSLDKGQASPRYSAEVGQLTRYAGGLDPSTAAREFLKSQRQKSMPDLPDLPDEAKSPTEYSKPSPSHISPWSPRRRINLAEVAHSASKTVRGALHHTKRVEQVHGRKSSHEENTHKQHFV